MDSNETSPQPAGDLGHVLGDCIRCNYIDSWCKLVTILWFCEHRGQHYTLDELGAYLFQGDQALMGAALGQLVRAGFLVETAREFSLSDDPQVTVCLDHLVETFADPLARQQLLEQLREVETGERSPCHDEWLDR